VMPGVLVAPVEERGQREHPGKEPDPGPGPGRGHERAVAAVVKDDEDADQEPRGEGGEGEGDPGGDAEAHGHDRPEGEVRKHRVQDLDDRAAVIRLVGRRYGEKDLTGADPAGRGMSGHGRRCLQLGADPGPVNAHDRALFWVTAYPVWGYGRTLYGFSAGYVRLVRRNCPPPRGKPRSAKRVKNDRNVTYPLVYPGQPNRGPVRGQIPHAADFTVEGVYSMVQVGRRLQRQVTVFKSSAD